MINKPNTTMFTTSKNRQENINTAIELLHSVGISDVRYSGYSKTNGISVYFKHNKMMDDFSIRVSDHGISNRGRMETTLCFDFDIEGINPLTGKEVKIDGNNVRQIIAGHYPHLKTKST